MSRAFIAFYPGDYLRDTAHLTTEEHGAYLLLLMHCWIHGSIPDPPSARALIARVSLQKWRHLRGRLDPFFDGHGRQKRATIEIEKAEKTRLKQTMAGARGAAKRWGTYGHGYNPDPPSGDGHGVAIKNSKITTTEYVAARARASGADAPQQKSGSATVPDAAKARIQPSPELAAIIEKKQWIQEPAPAPSAFGVDDLASVIRAKGWVQS